MSAFEVAWAGRSEGLLDVGDGHQMWWCELGAADGIPLVVVHGGPGGGTVPEMAAPYDPHLYRVVMFDQRGCGRSLPHASEPTVSLAANTTAHLVRDMERLREHRGVDSWVVSGSSWGTTLGLAYACAHPDRVRAVLLRSITTYSAGELDWVYRDGASRLLPEAWEEFATAVEATDLVDGYRRALEGEDDQRRLEAALGWCRWELAGMRAEPGSPIEAVFTEPRFATAFARISTHYAANRGFVDHGGLWTTVPTLARIPATFIQGRLDLCTPPATAWRLHRRWPGSRLHLLDDEGHRLTGAAATMRAVLDEYADQLA
ncbi:prolyl aminopeptidase [Nocardioides sp. CER19]|uniref:prolyl aminopeptidase n=1 Tax=Nocardioides sp. CER19 TaxID=3038538 RepID=UPI002447CDF9|nr:prolyl aminopeptidase [Nocardioides sp. CER19]MDH2416670.1 prolyl aminopeptidase [Nocardioides sp. CER19]